MGGLLLNRAKANTSTTGTGAATPGTAVVPFQTWAAAGATASFYYSYLIEDGTAWECGTGLYNGTTITRPGPGSDPTFASSTGSLINLSGSATIACVATKDANQLMLIGSWTYSSNVATVDFTNLGGFSEYLIVARLLTTSASGFRFFYMSVDNGSNWYTTSGNYVDLAAAGTETNSGDCLGHSTATTAARTLVGRIIGNQNGNPPVIQGLHNGLSKLFLASSSPMNALRMATTGTNYTGGSVRIYGRV